MLLLFAVGMFVYSVMLYNELVRLRNDNDRAWANVDVLLKQRHDEIPNLVETVKGYMQHEQQTLLAVTRRAQLHERGQHPPESTGRSKDDRRGACPLRRR